MTEKRYAIVRVDKITKRDTDYYVCPSYFENINDKFVCDTTHKDHIACKDCRYGDTKEQLIAKVKQALRRKLKDDKIVYIGIPKKRNIRIETLAKEIVEFLGVEE